MPDDPAAPVRHWHHLTSPEVETEVERDPVLVLPLAAIEQHGPHLPLSTDLDIATGLARRAFDRLSADCPAWLLPPLSVGASQEHLGFPGTLSLAPGMMERIIRSIGADVARSGVRRLVLLNAHGGNRAALESAGLALRREEEMLVVKADYVRFPRLGDAGLPESEWRHGIHGGALETAMMLHLRPDAVRRDAIVDHGSLDTELEEVLTRITAGGPAGFSWLAQDLNVAGVVGDARLATAELGERLVAHYGEVLAEIIHDARTFPLERLG